MAEKKLCTKKSHARSFDAGCVGYLTKPINRDDLLNLVSGFAVE